jgi:hypothetical protein
MVAGMFDEDILKKLKTNKITNLQIDPFGYCNAKCWFCPVAYRKMPARTAKHMSPDLFEKIIQNIVHEKEKLNGIVSTNFNHFYTAHYNEILLYKYLEEMLNTAQKYNLKTSILSNGTNFTEKKIEILKKYENTIAGIYLNIPAFEESLWKERSGIKNKSFEDLRKNIINLMKVFPEMVKEKKICVGVNIPNEQSVDSLSLGKNAPSIDISQYGESFNQIKMAKKMFDGLTVYSSPNLTDRSGFLSKEKIIDNNKLIQINKYSKKEVKDCNLGEDGRLYGWVHVNSLGETFICCNDYDYEYVFGSLQNKELSEIWFSKEHIETIKRSLETMCKKCCNAVWG